MLRTCKMYPYFFVEVFAIVILQCFYLHLAKPEERNDTFEDLRISVFMFRYP